MDFEEEDIDEKCMEFSEDPQFVSPRGVDVTATAKAALKSSGSVKMKLEMSLPVSPKEAEYEKFTFFNGYSLEKMFRVLQTEKTLVQVNKPLPESLSRVGNSDYNQSSYGTVGAGISLSTESSIMTPDKGSFK